MRDIKKFLVCGGGMMGSAIAQILAAMDGAQVTVYDVYPVDVGMMGEHYPNKEFQPMFM